MAAGALCTGPRHGAVLQQVRHTSVTGFPARGNSGWGLAPLFLSAVFGRAEGLSHDLFGPSLDSGNSLCYRTEPFRGGIFGRIAQLVEQLTLNQRVPGSSPGAPTNEIKDLGGKRDRGNRGRIPIGST